MIVLDLIRTTPAPLAYVLFLIGFALLAVGISGGGLTAAGWSIPVIAGRWRQALLAIMGVFCLMVAALNIINLRLPGRGSYSWVALESKGDICCVNIASSATDHPISSLGIVQLCDDTHHDYMAVCWSDNMETGFPNTPRDFVPPRRDWCVYKRPQVKDIVPASDVLKSGTVFECKASGS